MRYNAMHDRQEQPSRLTRGIDTHPFFSMVDKMRDRRRKMAHRAVYGGAALILGTMALAAAESGSGAYFHFVAATILMIYAFFQTK